MQDKWRLPIATILSVALATTIYVLYAWGDLAAEPHSNQITSAGNDASSANERVIKIGTADFPPFRIAKDGQPVSGVDFDVVDLVFKNLGVKYELVVAPWKRTYANGAKGQLDAIFSFTQSEERSKDFIFSDGFNAVKDVLFKRKGEDITWQTLADLKGKRIGASSGYNYPKPFMDAIEQKFFLVDMVTGAIPEEQHMAKLLKNRIDLFICEVSVCSWIIKNNDKFAGIDYIDKAVGPVRPFRMGFPKARSGSADLQAAFNRELAKIQKAGLDRPLFKKYGLKRPF